MQDDMIHLLRLHGFRPLPNNPQRYLQADSMLEADMGRDESFTLSLRRESGKKTEIYLFGVATSAEQLSGLLATARLHLAEIVPPPLL